MSVESKNLQHAAQLTLHASCVKLCSRLFMTQRFGQSKQKSSNTSKPSELHPSGGVFNPATADYVGSAPVLIRFASAGVANVRLSPVVERLDRVA